MQEFYEMNADEKVKMMHTLLQSIDSEFNRPMEIIGLNGEFLTQYCARHSMPEEVQDAIVDINNASLFLNRLFQNFVELTMSLTDAFVPQFEMIDLYSLLRDMCADHTEIYERIGVKVSLQCEEKQCIVCADRRYAERVCLNLLSNCLRACHGNGEILFNLSCDAQTKEHALSVTDTSGALRNALNPLSQYVFDGEWSHDTVAQANIGFYLCGEYCRLMGWKMQVVSQEGVTKLCIAIPEMEQTMQTKVCFSTSIGEACFEKNVAHRRLLRTLRLISGLEELGKGK